MPRRLLKEYVILLVLAMLVVIPLLGLAFHGVSGRAVRNGSFQGIGTLLLLALLVRGELWGGPWRLGYLARSGVNAPLAAVLIWATLSGLHPGSPPGVLWGTNPVEQAFAVADLLRLGFGALIYFALTLHIEERSQLRLLLDCLLGLVIGAMLYGLCFQWHELAYLGEKDHGILSVFPSLHHLSAILTILFPLLLCLSREKEPGTRRTAAVAAAALCGVGLLLCLERSAWIATGVGVLLLRRWRTPAVTTRPSGRPWRRILLIAGSLLAVGCVMAATRPGVLLTHRIVRSAAVLQEQNGAFESRAERWNGITRAAVVVLRRTVRIVTALRGRDRDFNWRVQKWRGATRMVAERPVWGWGPGQFVLHQYPYTHLGSQPEKIRHDGASFDDLAYNEYLHTTAELGVPGLILYLLLLAAFFSKASRALRHLPSGLYRVTLRGCMAGVGAQTVDALANGSWHFSECNSFFWLVLGLGVAAIQQAYPATSPTPALEPARRAADEPIAANCFRRPDGERPPVQGIGFSSGAGGAVKGGDR